MVCFRILFSLSVCKLVSFQSISAADCEAECGDVHRACPGINDPSFYSEYVRKFEAGELGDFSDAPLPPPPSCSDPFYKIGCRQSCKLCTPCSVDSADVQQILGDVVDSITCDACTHVLGNDADGKPTCLTKYETFFEAESGCSCDCGQGTHTFVKKCKKYQKQSGQCTQVDTGLENCDDGEPATKTEICNNGYCIVSKIFEKTLDLRNSGSFSLMTYEGYTKDGQVCHIGVVKKTNNLQRDRGGEDTYTKTEMDHPECHDICLQKGETFDYVKITTDGADGWESDYVEVTVNGQTGKYATEEDVDDHETVIFYKKE